MENQKEHDREMARFHLGEAISELSKAQGHIAKLGESDFKAKVNGLLSKASHLNTKLAYAELEGNSE